MTTPRQPSSSQHPDLMEPVTPGDHARGPQSAAVTLVEYGDFQCPYCAHVYPVVRELEQRFGADLRVVFRHNPRAFDHPRAAYAAEAAEAAGEQGRFWEMHDQLFEHQSALEDRDLLSYARTLGLDLERFGADLSERRHKARVHADELGGVRSHVISTPTFFINGQRFGDTPDLESLSRAITAARDAARFTAH
jgi:formate-nitrite transporter family protein